MVTFLLKTFLRAPAISVSQTVDEGIEHGSEDGVKDRDHFVLLSSVIGFEEKILDDD